MKEHKLSEIVESSYLFNTVEDVPEMAKGLEDSLESMAESILNWWEDAQYLEAYAGRNLFDDDPDFVIKAKAAWVEHRGIDNPNNWLWLEAADELESWRMNK